MCAPTCDSPHRKATPPLRPWQGYVRLVDFGLCRRLGERGAQRAFTVCGTPQYTAPEVVRGSGHGCEVDLWGLGVLLFELLAGYSPFAADDPVRAYALVLQAAPATPLSFPPTARALIAALLRAAPHARLGALRNGAVDVGAHAFFGSLDWMMLLGRRLPPPVVPLTPVGEAEGQAPWGWAEASTGRDVTSAATLAALEAELPVEARWHEASQRRARDAERRLMVERDGWSPTDPGVLLSPTPSMPPGAAFMPPTPGGVPMPPSSLLLGAARPPRDASQQRESVGAGRDGDQSAADSARPKHPAMSRRRAGSAPALPRGLRVSRPAAPRPAPDSGSAAAGPGAGLGGTNGVMQVVAEGD